MRFTLYYSESEHFKSSKNSLKIFNIQNLALPIYRYTSLRNILKFAKKLITKKWLCEILNSCKRVNKYIYQLFRTTIIGIKCNDETTCYFSTFLKLFYSIIAWTSFIYNEYIHHNMSSGRQISFTTFVSALRITPFKISCIQLLCIQTDVYTSGPTPHVSLYAETTPKTCLMCESIIRPLPSSPLKL